MVLLYIAFLYANNTLVSLSFTNYSEYSQFAHIFWLYCFPLWPFWPFCVYKTSQSKQRFHIGNLSNQKKKILSPSFCSVSFRWTLSPPLILVCYSLFSFPFSYFKLCFFLESDLWQCPRQTFPLPPTDLPRTFLSLNLQGELSINSSLLNFINIYIILKLVIQIELCCF